MQAGLRAADVADAVDGSMFLTERDGGSDLGRTVHCSARDVGDGRVEISGEKWFCSNVDGAAIVMLARPEGAPDGPTGLGLYLVPRVLEDGSPNRYSIRRLRSSARGACPPARSSSTAPSATPCAGSPVPAMAPVCTTTPSARAEATPAGWVA